MKTINIKTIRIDGGTQSRVEINNEIVSEYAQAIQAGAEFPAVVVFNDGVDNWLADGFHRYHAHNQAGKTSIAVDTRTGSLRDAKLFSFGANGKHGQRPNQADRRKAIESMLNDAEWALWSNNAIAKTCEVSPHTVAARRESLCNLHSEKPTERTYTTKHGTTATMQTASIGKPSAIPKLTPEQLDRSVARIAADSNREIRQQIAELKSELTDEPEYTELDAAHDQITELQGQLAATIIGGASEDDKENAKALIADLQQRIKTLEATLKAVTISRDTYMNENAELRKQITRQRKEIDKATGKRTA